MKIKYIYNIGYGTCEESDYFQLCHEIKYSQREFEKIIVKIVMKEFKGHKVEKDEKISFQDILYRLVEELTKNFGFKRVKFTAEFNVFGWANLLDKKDWEEDRNIQLNMLTNAIEKVTKKSKNKCERKK